MKYNYIFIRELENDNKMSISKALKDCSDIKDIKLF
jgi:hypothetical protein